MGSSTQVYEKVKGQSFNLYRGRLENVPVVVFCTTRHGKRFLGCSKSLESHAQGFDLVKFGQNGQL